MRKSLLFLAVVSTAMYLTSCSKSDGPGPGGDVSGQPVGIKIGGKTLSVSPITKAPIDDIPSSGLKARVLASNTSKLYDAAPNLIRNGTMTFTTSTAAGFDGSEEPFPHAINPVYLVGLYPTISGADWTVAGSGTTATYTFNGSHDVMATNEIFTVRKDVTTSAYKILNFHHLLTRLNFTVQASDDDAAEAWGKVTSIKVKSPAQLVTVTLGETTSEGKPKNDFTAADTWMNVYGIGTEAVLPSTTLPLTSATPKAQGYIMVAPKDGATTNQVKYDLIITTENHPADYGLTVALQTTGGAEFNTYSQSLQFDIKLTFSSTFIKAVATVEPWGKGGTGSSTIQ